MSVLEYLPSDWLDEYVPERAHHPSQFLYLEDGKVWLRPIEDGDKREQPHFWRELTDGEEVAFSVFRDFGTWTVTVNGIGKDGHPDFTGGADIPGAANCFWDDDGEDVSETLEECVKLCLDNNPGFSGDLSINAYAWNDSESSFRLRTGRGMDESLTAHFVEFPKERADAHH